MSRDYKPGDFADAGCGTCEWLQCMVCAEVNCDGYDTYVTPEGRRGFFSDAEIMNPRENPPKYPSSRFEWLRLHGEPHTESPTKEWQ